MPICAYCKRESRATREHVIPAFIYAFQQQLAQSVVGWNEVVQRMVRGEAKVRDVCAECNHTALSVLDSYGRQLLSDSGLLVQNYTKRTLTIRYDYSLLLRWLLKISFNSSRTDGAHSGLFEEHIQFMRGLSPPPPVISSTSRRIFTACRGRGTTCGYLDFILAAGMTIVAASRSTSVHSRVRNSTGRRKSMGASLSMWRVVDRVLPL